jgi:apolipoprotein D and lipocalin family protein
LTLASDVDLDRYAGRWHVIANIPYFAEKGNVGSYFDVPYRQKPSL